MNELERKRVGETLRQLRLKNNLTLKEVADRIEKTPKTVQLYETTNTTISLDVIIMLCQIYGVSVDELLNSAGI